MEHLRKRQHAGPSEAIRTVFGSEKQNANTITPFEMKKLSS